MTKTAISLLFALLITALAGTAVADSTAVSLTPELPKPDKILWVGYDEGVSRAADEDKHILIDFYTGWCGFCKKMDATTFRDRRVIDYINDNFVPIKIDGDSRGIVTHEGERMTQRELAKLFSVSGYPTYWFLESNGRQIGPAPGYRAAKDFLFMLEYVAIDKYKTMSLKNFVEQKKSGTG